MASNVVSFDTLAPIPDVSVLELAVVIVFARKPNIELATAAAEITRWFKVDVSTSDLAHPMRRLQHRAWLTPAGVSFRATEEAREKAEAAARGLVHLVFRDRLFFDVSKLLDVTIIREDKTRDF